MATVLTTPALTAPGPPLTFGRNRFSDILGHLFATRSRRVGILIIGILALSIADLAVTLTHLMTIGMAEANPVARWLMQVWPSPWALGVFKLATVLLSVGLLYRFRRQRISELGAWCAILVLATMAVQWHHYGNAIDDPQTLQLAMDGAFGDSWVVWN